ncbi:hypothetical protein [Roseospirillum parvum]|uniref:Uncharacterized protein n=1 Tax=Roseospirillum parvum TaxID=83401 RepID=A0A1G8EL52_9PROT|nr:hypothetical protein [Roseospirillum parvum]SDH70586.1 hypothetical protein SAMN05421742_11075 [Roseospirillum parvum]
MNETVNETTTATTTPAVDLSHESGMAGWEIAVVGLAALLAMVFLWRTYFARRGKKGPACASCGSKQGCSAAH